jgi:SAM-dependent methyltransferase
MSAKTTHADAIDVERRRGELPFGMESRDEARNYFAWQADMFRPYARGTVIDHGAGTGGLSSAMLELPISSLVALEPDPQLTAVLRHKFDARPDVRVFEGTLDGYIEEAGPESIDLIVSSNVIEHIDDDEACLRVMARMLKPGGAVGLYVPARPELYGSLDEAVGHCRRYTRPELISKLERAGLTVKHAEYRNLVGVLPWLVTGRVLRQKAIGRGSVRMFDRVVFPVCRRLEDLVTPPYGLNLVAIGVRS